MKIRNALIAGSTAFLVLTGQASAAPGQWTGGYGQGIWEANVGNHNNATFYVACPDAALNRARSVSLEVPGLSGGQDGTLQGSITVDGRETPWTFQRRVLDQGQVAISSEGSAVTALIPRLRAGRQLTVRIPAENLVEDFVLTGSGAALRDCVS